MYLGLKKQEGWSALTRLPYLYLCGELQWMLDRGFITMYLVENHNEHIHYFIVLKKGKTINDSYFKSLFADSYNIKTDNSKDFIEYMHFNEEVC